MARSKNKKLGSMTVKLNFATDGDGDVVLSIDEVVAISGMTANLEEIIDSGIYSAPDEGDFLEPVKDAVATRPNRRRD